MTTTKVELPQTLERAIQDYNDWSYGYLRRAEHRGTITKPLYHYTDMDGLKGILNNKTLWFTDYRHLNDPNELMHGIALAKAILKRRFNGEEPDNYLCRWIDGFLTGRIFDRAFEFFIASFSRDGDELGQWRAYADDGTGVAIGFAPGLFAPNEEKNKDPRKNVFVGPVLYRDTQTQRRHAKGIDKSGLIVNAAYKYAVRHLRDSKIQEEFVRQLALSVVATPLLWNALTCKHWGYRQEDEVRLVILGDKRGFKGKVSKRTRDGQVVRYIPYSIPKIREPGNIARLVIGPAAPMSAEADIKKLLDSLGMKVRVIGRSTIPYRSRKIGHACIT